MEEEKRIVIDLRSKGPQEPVVLDADLIIGIDLYDDGYTVVYCPRMPDGRGHYELHRIPKLDRETMVSNHVKTIQALKPKTVVIRSGEHSTGHVRDIPLHPGVIKSIIEGKLGAEKLMLRG